MHRIVGAQGRRVLHVGYLDHHPDAVGELDRGDRQRRLLGEPAWWYANGGKGDNGSLAGEDDGFEAPSAAGRTDDPWGG